MRPAWRPLGLFLSLVSSSAVAHDTWLLPQAAAPPAGAPVRLEPTSGMRFPDLESAILPERVRRAAHA